MGKLKGLYVAFEFQYKSELLSDKNSIVDGIEKKIFCQYQTFESYGYDMEFYNPYINRQHSVEKYLRRLPFHFLKKWDFDYSIAKKVDFVYIRKAWFMDGDIILFVKKLKTINPLVKIMLEIPTYPYDSEGKKIDMLPLKIKDRFWRRFLSKYIDRIVTYSDDKNIFHIETIRTSNAIDFLSSKRHRILKENVGNDIKMIACASLYYWHGYDRLIKGLKNYYMKEKYPYNLKVYIVGIGAEYKKYQEMITRYKLEEHIILTGYKSGQELDDIYDMCVIGFDSLGRHRSGVSYNSSLKGKEYCAKGLMIVSGVNTELDFEKEFKYYYRIPADDSPVDFKKVVEFYHEIINGSDISVIQESIMKFAKSRFDFKVTMNSIRQFIEG